MIWGENPLFSEIWWWWFTIESATKSPTKTTNRSVSGWWFFTNPSEKYSCSPNWKSSPNFRCEHITKIETTSWLWWIHQLDPKVLVMQNSVSMTSSPLTSYQRWMAMNPNVAMLEETWRSPDMQHCVAAMVDQGERRWRLVIRSPSSWNDVKTWIDLKLRRRRVIKGSLVWGCVKLTLGFQNKRNCAMMRRSPDMRSSEWTRIAPNMQVLVIRKRSSCQSRQKQTSWLPLSAGHMTTTPLPNMQTSAAARMLPRFRCQKSTTTRPTVQRSEETRRNPWQHGPVQARNP